MLAALLAADPASAQTARSLNAPADHTIVVTGRGVVRIPADRMRIDIRFFNRGIVPVRQAGAASGATPAPIITAADFDAAGKTIADVLRMHGVPDARWMLPVLGALSPQGASPSIVGTIAKPTRERVEAIMRDALVAMPDSLAWMATNVQIQTTLGVDDCGPAEARAQQAAIADARVRAASIAQAAGVRLGSIVAVNELGSSLGGCRTKPDDLGILSAGGFNAGQAEPVLDVPIIVSATVTFAIH
jgi:hypothetical protein